MSGPATHSADAERTVELLNEALAKWDVVLSDEDIRAYRTYANMLVEWNATRFNLTRLITPEQIALNHFLDSLALIQVCKVPSKALMIDIGTGPGFPGLAFKILRRDIKLVLIESTAKKLSFCKAVAQEVNLTGVEFVHGRAEDSTVLAHFCKKASIVTARAVAPLKTLLEWTAPLASSTGSIVAWKGPKVLEEVSEAYRTAERLGLKVEVVERKLAVEGIAPVSHFYVVCTFRR